LGRAYVEGDGVGQPYRLLEPVGNGTRGRRRPVRHHLALAVAGRALDAPQRYEDNGACRRTPALDGTAAPPIRLRRR
jgi:hypothetical protein